MTHPAETAAGMDKRAWTFLGALPWLLMAAPFATQLIDRFRGGTTATGGQDPFAQLQVKPRPRPQPRRGVGDVGDVADYEQYLPPALMQTAQGLHRYRRAGY